MGKIQNFSIVASFAGLWLTTLLPSSFEVILGFLFIFSFGIFHGSNDISLIRKLSNQKSSAFSFQVFLVYITIVLVAVLLLYIIPDVLLLLFIIFSAFHFGEQQFQHIQFHMEKKVLYLYYVLYGLTVLFLLFALNPSDVIAIVKSIANLNLTSSLINSLFSIILVSYLLTTVVLILKHREEWKIIITEFIYLICLSVIFKVSTLIWGFTIYFIFWHSIPSLVEQVNFLFGSVNPKHMVLYIKNAFWYWLISLIGIAMLYFVFGENTLFYSILFSFIAAVTFPHTIVINNMFKSKKTQPN